MKLKRIMAMVLCFAMVLSTMSFSVFAEDATAIVSNYDELVAALANVEAEKTIEISADITIDTKITIPDGVILDLKDNTLYVNVENSYYNNVTIMNGDIVLGKDDVHVCDGYFLVNEGKTLVLNNVNMSSADGGIKGYAVFHLKTGANLDLIDSELDIRDNEYSEGYIVYAGESTASVDVTGTTVSGTNVNGIVHATTVIDNSTFTIGDANEHGINRSAVTINDSTVTISGGTGRGITAQHGDLVISGNSVVNISDMGEATIELRGDKNLTVDDTATVTVDAEVNNTTSGTISGDVTVEGDTPSQDPSSTIVATVDGEEFTDLQEAIVAAAPSGTVEIVDDVVVDEWVMFAQSLSIGNGSIITINMNGLTINGNNHSITVKGVESASNGDHLFSGAEKLNINNLTFIQPEGLGGISLVSGEIKKVTFKGGSGIFPGNGDITVDDCEFQTDTYCIYYEAERDNLIVTGCEFTLPADKNVILLRGNTTFTNNIVNSGRTVNVVSGSPVVTGNDFNDVRLKVYNVATATIEDNEINVLAFNDESEVKSTFGENTLSAEAQAVLDAADFGAASGLAGTGEKEDPYLINNIEDLKWFRDSVNDTKIDGSNQYTGKYIKLTSDIDLKGEEWTPIGVYDASKDHINFQGIFDGDGHKIYNLKINSTNRAGFFGELGLSTDFGGVTAIKNITFENVDVVSTAGYVGAVASNPFCVTFDNVHVTGKINIKGGSYTAVIAGHGYANFNNCSVDGGENKGTVESTGWAVGGIAGHIGDFGSDFTNCTVKNLVIKTPICGAAAIAGYGADFKNSSNLYAENVDIIAESASYPGCNGLLFGLYGAGDNFAAIANSSAKGCSLTEGGEKIELYYDMVAEVGGVYYTELQSAIAAAQNGDTITLLSDVELEKSISFTKDITLTIDGAGFSIKPAEGSTETNSAFNFGQGSNATVETRNYTIKNIVFDGWTTDHVLRLQGVNATVDNCKFINCNQPDGLGLLTLTYCKATVEDCVFEDNTCVKAIDVNSNANADAANATEIKNCTFENNNCIGPAGVIEVYEGAFTIKDSKFIGNKAVSASIFCSTNADISGNYFAENTYTGTKGNEASVLAGPWVKGTYAIGINNNAFTDENVPGAFVEDWSATYDVAATYNLNGNYWNGGEPNYAVSGEPEITLENYYTTYVDGVLDDLVEIATAVAQIGEGEDAVQYTSLQDAENGAVDGDTIVLLDNIELSKMVTFYNAAGARNVTLDMNGKTITLSDSWSDSSAFWVCDGLTIIGNGTINAAPAGDPFAYCFIVGQRKPDTTEGTYIGNLVIENGKFYSDDASVVSVTYGSATINGGTIESVGKQFTLNCIDAMYGADKASIIVNGGTFVGFNPQNNTSEGAGTNFCAEGYAALPDLDGNYVVGKKPTATVNNLGMQTIPAGNYTNMSGSNTEDMPLSFVMEFIANETAEEGAASPYAEWYADFVITVSGLENGSFDTTGCYLAGHYGDFGWVKVPIDELLETVEEDVRYPVMLGVNSAWGQKYQYICSGVENFKCAMFLTDEVLEANPNLTVNLELAVVDNSEGGDAAASALVSGENTYKVTDYEYTAKDFEIKEPVAQIGETKYETFEEAITAAEDGDVVTLLSDVALDAPVTIKKSITIDGNGHSIAQSAECNNNIALLYFEGAADNVLDVAVENTTFDGLKVGAAIRTLYANMNIDNCVFQNCEHTVGQGLVRLTYGTANITNSKFLNNDCSMGISFNWDGNGLATDTLTVDNCEFTGNTANKTALIYYVKGVGCEIKNSDFKNNDVNTADNCAVVYLGFMENCSVTGCLFEDNDVVDSSASTRVAGAVFFGYEADISDNAFINNTASNANGDALGQICTSTYYECDIDLGGNYWGGDAPIYGKDFTVQHQTGDATFSLDTYYASYSFDENGNVVVADEIQILYVAQVGKFGYTDLQSAIDNANGKTVTVLTDIALAEGVVVPEKTTVTLDLNGKTITGTDNATVSFALIEVQPDAELIINDTSAEKSGKITLASTNNRGWNAYSSVISNQRGKLTVNGGTIEHLGGTDMAYGIDNLTNTGAQNAETIINAGTIKSTYRAIRQFLNSTKAQNILTVNGGTVEGANKSIWMQDANASANPGALTVTENAVLNGDVYLTVTKDSTEWPVEVSIAAVALNGESQVLTNDNVPEGYEVVLENGYYGVQENEPAEMLFEIAGTTATLGNSLALNFYWGKLGELTEEGYYAVVEHQKEDGVVTTTIPFAEWIASGSYEIICYTGLAAKEMADKVKMTIYYEDGTPASDTYEISLRQYALDRMDRYVKDGDTDNLWLPALIDMLNYGAAAQEEFGYNLGDLANTGAETFQQYASPEYTLDKEGCALTGTVAGTTLMLKDVLNLNVYFNDVTAGMKATYSYTTHAGTLRSGEVDYNSFISGYGFKGVAVDVSVANADSLVTVTMFKNDVTVAGEAVYSANAYLLDMINKPENKDKAIYPMLAKFAASAKKAFVNQK